MTVLETVMSLLGIADDTAEMKLSDIVELTESRLKVLTGADEVPDALKYIVVEVSIIRYNRIGSEGVTSHSVEGESMTFSDNDFSAYLDDIETWKNKNKGVSGTIRFL